MPMVVHSVGPVRDTHHVADVDADQVIVEAMNTLSHRVLMRDDTAYAVALEAGPLLFPVWETADHAGAAYRLW